MPPTLFPAELPGNPRRYVLSSGTSLWRVHRSGRPADEFQQPRLVAGFGGNRFDGVGRDGYPYLYCSPDSGTAIAEHFVRDLEFSVTATRVLPRKALQARTASVVRTTTDLELLSLVTGPDLAAVGQDGWLTSARGPEFDLTRRWARWLRDRAGWAQGFVWQSSVDLPKPTMVLFGDACHGRDVEPDFDMVERLDEPANDGWLRHHLRPHGVVLDPAAPVDTPRIFINYRTGNAGLAAHELDRALTARLGDAAVFLDRRSIAPGRAFPPELLDKVRGCSVLLVVVGAGWEQAATPAGTPRLADEQDWVRREIREAVAHRVPVVPVLVGARPPLVAEELPVDMRFLAEHQYLHVPDGFGPEHVAIAVDRLLTRFHGLAA